MSVEHPSDNAPPPVNIEAVRQARALVKDAHPAIDGTVSVFYLEDLLEAYDTLAARHALLAAKYAELIAEVTARRQPR